MRSAADSMGMLSPQKPPSYKCSTGLSETENVDSRLRECPRRLDGTPWPPSPRAPRNRQRRASDRRGGTIPTAKRDRPTAHRKDDHLPAQLPAGPVVPFPAQRTPSPTRRTPSPTRRTPSPTRRTPSPTRRTPSPTRRTPSPRRFDPSPRYRRPSSTQRTPSARRSGPSPSRRSPPPRSGPSSPSPRSPSPAHGEPSRGSWAQRGVRQAPRRPSAPPNRRIKPDNQVAGL